MNISAIAGCTPIKPQVSFGSDQKRDYNKVVSAANNIADSFDTQKKQETKTDENIPEKKSKLGVLVSLGAACLVMYAGGKFAASKVNEIFPKFAPAFEKGLKRTADFVKEKSSALAEKDGKIASTAGRIVEGAEKTARNIYKKCIKKDGNAAEAFKNLAGAAAVAVGLPQIAAADGNKDGIRDISQKNVNAYKSAIENVGFLSEIVNILS